MVSRQGSRLEGIARQISAAEHKTLDPDPAATHKKHATHNKLRCEWLNIAVGILVRLLSPKYLRNHYRIELVSSSTFSLLVNGSPRTGTPGW